MNTKDANAQSQGHQRPPKEQAMEADQTGNGRNYYSNINYICNEVKTCNEHENSMESQLVGLEYRNRGSSTSKSNTIKKVITIRKLIPTQSLREKLVVNVWGK